MSIFETRQPPRPLDFLLYLFGVAGLAASITVMWLGMRAVMDIGGFCADGGPYVIEHPCPQGAAELMFLAFPGWFAFTGLIAWKGARIGPPYGVLAVLAWTALFLALGWNFLEYGLPGPLHPGIELGWLVPGVIFVVMGLAPLGLFYFAGSASAGSSADPQAVERLRRSLERAQRTPPSSSAGSVMAVADPPPSGAGTDLVSQLERLAALQASGALTDAEYESAKRALLRAEGGG